MAHPSLVLTSQFVVPTFSNKSYSKYLDYMDRKEALEKRGAGTDTYLEKENKDKLNAIKNNILHFEIEKIKYQTPINSLDSNLTKRAKIYLNEINISDFNEKEFKKFIESDKPRKLNGVFSIDNDNIQIGEDTKHVRDMLNYGEKHGSVLWQDVISFDTNFLVRHHLLDQETDTLNSKAMIRASHKMMDEFQDREKLNNPYWVASIHRNTGNVHIHFATVEQANSRKIQVKDGKSQPRGKRKQSTIDHMKSVFTNELLDTSELLKEINVQRNTVRRKIVESYRNLSQGDKLQNDISKLITLLPKNKQKWHYASLQKDQKELLNGVTDKLLSNNKDYNHLKLNISRYSANREEIYGKSKRQSKNYTQNKMQDIQKRVGNALLHELSSQMIKQDKRKKKIQTTLTTFDFQKNGIKPQAS
ncbi:MULTISPECIES: MobP2 family relaxase [Lactobacillus]|uniref:MobP2 family relaxase n=1 Tax=Lactobacillus TaxID=1578 RepID=UPI00248FD23F|nr:MULTISPECIES: MobP2 family relaxase [Lactobacillus]